MKRRNGSPLASPLDGVLRSGVIVYLGFLVVLPIFVLVHRGFTSGLEGIYHAISSPESKAALKLTLVTAGAVAFLNGIFGTAAAWILVRYRFLGRTFLSTLIDLPLAIPTLVTGIMLVLLLGPASPIGQIFSDAGMPIVYHTPAIVLALAFVSFPYAVRTVEPVLMELDPAEEEAAWTLGASTKLTFFKVVLPALLPAVISGALQCFARALAEFGSIIVVSGNIPFSTLTAPVFIFGEVESGRSDLAASISIVLLAIALLMTAGARASERFVRSADA
jgi:sulfate transport system permease protein